MSMSVAASAVGLLDRPFTPPTDPRESHVSQWHDHMEVDRSSQEHHADAHNDSSISKLRRSTGGAQSGDERRNALGGLLAALATNSTDKHIGPSNSQDREHRSVTPPQDSPISIESPTEPVAALKQDAPHDSAVTAPAEHLNAKPAYLPEIQTENDLANISAYQPEFDPVITTTLDNIPIPAFEMPTEPIPQTPTLQSPHMNIKRQYDAFARLEFDDGIFYLNTYQCELGRDQHAYHIALQREREAQEAADMAKKNPDSSRSRASQLSNIIKAESQIQGSVVSEAGGFAGVDQEPVEGYGPKQNGKSGRSRGSHSSDASIVRPADVLHNPSLHTPFDYNKEASRQFAPPAPPIEKAADEDEQPAPITADHLPDPNSCPLIPIHVTSESETTELDGLKAISRRHMKIFWSWEHSSFMLEILGRNGAFLEGEFIAPAQVVPLYTGANIQISSVNFVFRLPHIEPVSPSIDSVSNIGEPLEPSLTNLSEASEAAQKNKLKLKLKVDDASPQATLTNGESRRRGPGRPPKDGVMSQRERKEREKADKEAKTRTLNGDPSPPAAPQRKPSKSQPPAPELLVDSSKPEKRKYNKRKREDGEDDQVLPSIEAPDETPVIETPQNPPVAKKARTKSYSPPYKSRDECTQADLARPAHNYAVLLYQVLSQTGEISLRQIYKEMQSRWPYFKYIVESDGWTSSVRHNLNQEVGKLFLKGRKEGKGFTWLAKPNAMEEYQAQKNKRSNAPAAPRPRPAPTRANFAPNQGQQLTWQNSGPAPQPNGAGNAMSHPNQWSSAQNSHSRPHQPGAPGNGQAQMHGPNTNAHDIEAPTPAHMIVTFLGVRIIDRFENTMMSQLRQRYATDEDKLNRWSAVFRSARARCLNGAPASSLPEGETEDERTIMTHINNFVKMYKNPAFLGFHAGSQPAGVTLQTSTAPTPNNISAPTLPPNNSVTTLSTQTSTNNAAGGNNIGSGLHGGSATTASTSNAADGHSHPLPTPVPMRQTSTPRTANGQPAPASSDESHGDLPRTVAAATSSSSAIPAVPFASEPSPAKALPENTTTSINGTTVSSDRELAAAPAKHGSLDAAISNSATVPADTQPKSEPSSANGIRSSSDDIKATVHDTAGKTSSKQQATSSTVQASTDRDVAIAPSTPSKTVHAGTTSENGLKPVEARTPSDGGATTKEAVIKNES